MTRAPRPAASAPRE